MWNEIELRRLRLGPEAGERPGGLGLLWLVAGCAGNAEEVLDRCGEALTMVLRLEPDSWPAPDVWRLLLPEWFVRCCAEEPEEASGLPSRLDIPLFPAVTGEPWTVTEWISHFEPDRRQWRWWHAQVRGRNTLRIAIQVEPGRFSWGALAWLLRAAGAESVREEGAAEPTRLPSLGRWQRRDR